MVATLLAGSFSVAMDEELPSTWAEYLVGTEPAVAVVVVAVGGGGFALVGSEEEPPFAVVAPEGEYTRFPRWSWVVDVQ